MRRAVASDVPAVMRFIDEHWSRGHVLSQSRPLFDWQYADRQHPGDYNWFLGADSGGTIQGVLGFIPTWQFDPELEAEPVIWLALWKSRPAPENNGLGLALLGALAGWRSGGILAVQGINPTHPPMYRALGYRVGELAQYFVCNPRRTQSVIVTPTDTDLPSPAAGAAVFEPAEHASLRALRLDSAFVPRKTPAYFASRYLDHPFYRYRVFVIRLAGAAVGLVAARVAVSGPSRVLRFVDFMGDDACWSQCGSATAALMRDLDCEYADFWQFGLNPAAIEAAGFRRVERDGAVIVPNFFEPFLARNGRIEFAVKGSGESPIALFRGDGDQDRPNRLPSGQED